MIPLPVADKHESPTDWSRNSQRSKAWNMGSYHAPTRVRFQSYESDIVEGEPEDIRPSLSELYVFCNESEIMRFLVVHSSLQEPLRNAYYKITEFFPESVLSLDLLDDREASESRHLVAYITTKLPPLEATDRLEELWESWWLDKRHETKGLLSINLKFE